jgi:CubicO group peptidase (beta-lactamase class C family)
MKIWLGFPILLMLLAACAVEAPQDLAGQLDELLTELESEQDFRGSVLVAQNGVVLLSKGYGLADQERQIPNLPQTRYRIHWLTMPFSSMAIMQLQAAGMMDVHDEICEYIAECPEHWQAITIHHLLTHTAGIADEIQPWQGEREKPTTGLERVARIKHIPPYFPPGEQIRYSGNGYIILGAIIEVVSGQPYDNYLQMHIFQPLGMVNSGYQGNGVAVGYGPTGLKVPTPDLLFRYSAGGLYSSVEDLYLWDQALYTEKLLSQEDLARMFTGYARTPSMDFPGANYGYGWFVGQTLNRRVTFHGGWMSGYSAGILRFPEDHVTIIVLRNYEIPVYDRLEIELAEIVFREK